MQNSVNTEPLIASKIGHRHIHNLYAIFAKKIEIRKQIVGEKQKIGSRVMPADV